jgi:hypothetical protein
MTLKELTEVKIDWLAVIAILFMFFCFAMAFILAIWNAALAVIEYCNLRIKQIEHGQEASTSPYLERNIQIMSNIELHLQGILKGLNKEAECNGSPDPAGVKWYRG